MMAAPEFIEESVAIFRGQKRSAERAIAQLSDDQLHVVLGREENSIAIVMQHIAGNQLSRWTDFLTTDGEKPDRHCDTEFEARGLPREDLLALWERGWATLFAATTPLTAHDLARVVQIRGEPHTVTKAILRQLSHYATHVGQIVQLARHLRGDRFETLSIPRGGSEAFNRGMPR